MPGGRIVENRLLYTVFFTFLFTFVAVAVLSVVHGSTREIEFRNDLVQRQAAVLRAMGVTGFDSADHDGVDALYRELVRSDSDLYLRDDESVTVVGRVFRGAGVWGEISGVVAIDVEAMRVTGVEILRHSETPGLGGRVATPQFLDQLRDERIGPDGIEITVRGPGNSDPDDAKIDGITGATGTTTAFRRILTAELDELRGIIATMGYGG
jgi:Na+-transporting NADH:ubiquinone oxidoreductase subunit C